MADVARFAGVSTMTVSRALKSPDRVSEATRVRILEAVDRLGYVLDQSAGSLSSRRTGFIGAIVPSINNSNFADTARGITDAFEASGQQLLLGYTGYSVEKEERLIASMLRRRPEGIILTGGRHTERARRMLLNAAIPVVETWDLPADPLDMVVGFSNAEAMALLVRTLAARGYERFGYIGGTTERDTRGSQRRTGFVAALKRLSLPHDRLISFGVPPISMEQGAAALVSMLERWPDTQVVMCVSDLSAFGALMECHRRGIRVPQDVAIAGFGNYEISEYSYPGITSLDVGCYEIGNLAARQLIGAIEGGGQVEEPEGMIMTNYHVVERGST